MFQGTNQAFFRLGKLETVTTMSIKITGPILQPRTYRTAQLDAPPLELCYIGCKVTFKSVNTNLKTHIMNESLSRSVAEVTLPSNNCSWTELWIFS
jgi:hypothetical protein